MFQQPIEKALKVQQSSEKHMKRVKRKKKKKKKKTNFVSAILKREFSSVAAKPYLQKIDLNNAAESRSSILCTQIIKSTYYI
jgi:hypothetical protein